MCKNTTPVVDAQNIFTIVANEAVQDTLLKYKVLFQRLFSMSMLRSKTQSYCIKLREVVHLLKVVSLQSLLQDLWTSENSNFQSPLHYNILIQGYYHVLQVLSLNLSITHTERSILIYGGFLGLMLMCIMQTLVFGSEVPEDDLLKVILRTIYQFEIQGENQALYLNMEINFKELEMLMVQFSITVFYTAHVQWTSNL
jgi:hypothetical protein